MNAVLFVLLSLGSATSSQSSLVAPLDSSSISRRSLLSSATPAPGCLILASGDPLNPTSDSIGLIDIGGPFNDQDEHVVDGLNSADKKIDADDALKWCQAKFGATSYPMYPYNTDMYNAMKEICDAKDDQGNGYDCYFGLYRDVENFKKQKLSDGYDAEDCEEWYRYDGNVETFDISSYFDIGEPTCPWVDPNTQTAPYYDSSKKKHCVTYRTQSNKIATTKCHLTHHIICKYDGQCDPNATV